MFKVNNKNIRTTSVTSFWCFYCKLETHVDCEQVNVRWDNPCNQGEASLFILSCKAVGGWAKTCDVLHWKNVKTKKPTYAHNQVNNQEFFRVVEVTRN